MVSLIDYLKSDDFEESLKEVVVAKREIKHHSPQLSSGSAEEIYDYLTLTYGKIYDLKKRTN